MRVGIFDTCRACFTLHLMRQSIPSENLCVSKIFICHVKMDICLLTRKEKRREEQKENWNTREPYCSTLSVKRSSAAQFLLSAFW
jgi:hypothetical protein